MHDRAASAEEDLAGGVIIGAEIDKGSRPCRFALQ